jgi:putative flippase GtrA
MAWSRGHATEESMSIDTRREERSLAFWPRIVGSGRASLRRFGAFAVIGFISTGAFVAIYAIARLGMAPLAANFMALSLTMLFNFAANRKYTFEATHGALHVQGVQYLAVYLLGLGASSTALHLSLEVFDNPARVMETLIAVAAGGVATVIRFLLLSVWVFRPKPAQA